MIAAVRIQVELMMYGFAGTYISVSDNGINVSYSAVADGGDILANETLEIKGISFDALASQLFAIELPIAEDDEMSKSWSVSFFDENEHEVKSIELGYWSIEILNRIIELIDISLGDNTVTEWIHNIVEA